MSLRVLHLTAHLGGGVGKVLSRVVEQSARAGGATRHAVVCLEAPEKTQFLAPIQAHGELAICPTPAELSERIATADIVQLEWWHHPAIAAWLGSGPLPTMRLLVWSHVSGLHLPALAPDFVAAPARFLFTSPCSGEAPRLAGIGHDARQRTATVFSSGGFDDLPAPPQRPVDGPLRVGYVGSLNPAKIHPDFLAFVAALDPDAGPIRLIGDPAPGAALLAAAAAGGIASRLILEGYRTDIAATLAELDVFAYLLNPHHYGTAENALLEAMAMGVVPIVFDNPAERCLVEHQRTGLIVRTPAEFAQAIAMLARDPERRATMAAAAAASVRSRFAVSRTYQQLVGHYAALMADGKRPYDFTPIVGRRPADWFRAGLGEAAARFHDDGSVDLSGQLPHALREPSKGSVFHYARSFPDDSLLAAWARNLPPLP